MEAFVSLTLGASRLRGGGLCFRGLQRAQEREKETEREPETERDERRRARERERERDMGREKGSVVQTRHSDGKHVPGACRHVYISQTPCWVSKRLAVTSLQDRCHAKREQLSSFQIFLPESQRQNLALTVLCVSDSLDIGSTHEAAAVEARWTGAARSSHLVATRKECNNATRC